MNTRTASGMRTKTSTGYAAIPKHLRCPAARLHVVERPQQQVALSARIQIIDTPEMDSAVGRQPAVAGLAAQHCGRCGLGSIQPRSPQASQSAQC